MPPMRVGRRHDLDRGEVETVGDALSIFHIAASISKSLLKEPLAIACDTLGCLLGSDLVEKRKAQVLLKVPFQLGFLLFGEGITHGHGIFWPMIKTHRCCSGHCASGLVRGYGLLANGDQSHLSPSCLSQRLACKGASTPARSIGRENQPTLRSLFTQSLMF